MLFGVLGTLMLLLLGMGRFARGVCKKISSPPPTVERVDVTQALRTDIHNICLVLTWSQTNMLVRTLSQHFPVLDACNCVTHVLVSDKHTLTHTL